mmetsp:Transcript_35248/g.112388  ORF Transcript_35248/g.112388 Transcript_35248/m.112388 type:complete len:206 (+) Transcript_35248:1028-1645(+)
MRAVSSAAALRAGALLRQRQVKNFGGAHCAGEARMAGAIARVAGKLSTAPRRIPSASPPLLQLGPAGLRARATPRAIVHRHPSLHTSGETSLDVGMCGDLVETMVTLNSGRRVKPAQEAQALKSATAFAKKVDADGDGVASREEIAALAGRPTRHGEQRTIEELLSFHDVDQDGSVTAKEIEDSWVMFATAQHRASAKHGKRQEL